MPAHAVPQVGEAEDEVDRLGGDGRLSGRPGHNAGRTYPAEPLSRSEVATLLAAFNRGPTGIRNAALVALLYRGGLRIGEALALRPADVDLASGTARVLHGKGDKARTAWLDPDAVAHVARWVDARRKLGLRNGRLLCGLKGQAWTPQAAREALYRAARKAGLEKRVHPHGLRHSHAAELALEGVPTPVIQQQLGHANLAVTDRYLRGITSADVGRYIRGRQWTEAG